MAIELRVLPEEPIPVTVKKGGILKFPRPNRLKLVFRPPFNPFGLTQNPEPPLTADFSPLPSLRAPGISYYQQQTIDLGISKISSNPAHSEAAQLLENSMESLESQIAELKSQNRTQQVKRQLNNLQRQYKRRERAWEYLTHKEIIDREINQSLLDMHFLNAVVSDELTLDSEKEFYANEQYLLSEKLKSLYPYQKYQGRYLSRSISRMVGQRVVLSGG